MPKTIKPTMNIKDLDKAKKEIIKQYDIWCTPPCRKDMLANRIINFVIKPLLSQSNQEILDRVDKEVIKNISVGLGDLPAFYKIDVNKIPDLLVAISKAKENKAKQKLKQLKLLINNKK